MEDPDRKWKPLMRALFKNHEGRYEYHRIHLELQAQGYEIDHKKVQRLMRDFGLEMRKIYPEIPLQIVSGKSRNCRPKLVEPQVFHVICLAETDDRCHGIQVYRGRKALFKSNHGS